VPYIPSTGGDALLTHEPKTIWKVGSSSALLVCWSFQTNQADPGTTWFFFSCFIAVAGTGYFSETFIPVKFWYWVHNWFLSVFRLLPLVGVMIEQGVKVTSGGKNWQYGWLSATPHFKVINGCKKWYSILGLCIKDMYAGQKEKPFNPPCFCWL
jgi:hypothetical protein